jgi:CBS domain-containing protein
MKVREIMTSPAPVVSPDTRVGDVARLVLERGADGVAVVDVDGRLVGVVTENDLVEKHARFHAPWYVGFLGGVLPIDSERNEDHLRHVLSVTAAELMTRDPVTVSPDSDVDDAATVMVDRGIEPLVVVDGDTVVGLVSHADVIRLLVVEESDDDSASTE